MKKNTNVPERVSMGGNPLTPETITKEDVKKLISADATDKEIAIFLQIAKLNKLNPFKREIYLVKYQNQPAHIVTGYETYLKRAERSGKYAGFKVWTEGEGNGLKACIEVRRKDWEQPLYHEVEYSEYAQRKKDGSLTRFWKEKPKTMLKKVVISQAFRYAFPDELAGMPCISEEMPIDNGDSQKTSSKIEELQPPKAKKETPQSFIESEIAENASKTPVETKEPSTVSTTTDTLTPPKMASEGAKKASLAGNAKAINAKLKELKEKLGESDFNSIVRSAKVDLKKGCSIAQVEKLIDLLESYVIDDAEGGSI